LIGLVPAPASGCRQSTRCPQNPLAHKSEGSFTVPMRPLPPGTGDRECWNGGRSCEQVPTRDAAPAGQALQDLISRYMQTFASLLAPRTPKTATSERQNHAHIMGKSRAVCSTRTTSRPDPQALAWDASSGMSGKRGFTIETNTIGYYFVVPITGYHPGYQQGDA